MAFELEALERATRAPVLIGLGVRALLVLAQYVAGVSYF